MRLLWTMLVFTVGAALPAMAVAQAAQDLDCGNHVKTAQGAIDKTTEDMQGMENMPKDQLGSINTLLNDAKKQVKTAQQLCDKPKSDFDRARAIAQAEAARGSADAAGILHWHYMKAMPGMTGMPSSSDTSGKAMPGMKK